MTEATDHDRTDQQLPAVPEAAAPTTPADDVPEADALEQQQAVAPVGPSGPDPGTVDADEFDVVEQGAEVPVDEDDARG